MIFHHKLKKFKEVGWGGGGGGGGYYNSIYKDFKFAGDLL